MTTKEINLIAAITALTLLFYVTLNTLIGTISALRVGAVETESYLLATSGILILALYIQARTLVFCCFSYLFNKNNVDSLRRNPPRPYEDFISVIVPAYNESGNIIPTLQSIIDSDHLNLEIIVVNDGSSDTTSIEVDEFIHQNPNKKITLINKCNTGKWDAINHGVAAACYQFILLIDADSRLLKSSITNGIHSLKQHNVDVICGNISVFNTNTLCTTLQSLEYALTNCLRRRAQSYFSSVLIVPGPYGLYKRKVLNAISDSINHQKRSRYYGPLSSDTYAEDCDLTVHALCLGFKTYYESAAKVLTKAPENLFSLANQRYRWNRGHMQVSKKYLRASKRANIAIPFHSLVWIINTLVIDSLIMPFLFLLSSVAGIYLFLNGSVGQFLPQMILIMLGIEINLVIYCIRCEHEPPSHIPSAVFLPLYRIILIFSWVTAAFDEAKSRKMSW